jgi:hypothetical protein
VKRFGKHGEGIQRISGTALRTLRYGRAADDSVKALALLHLLSYAGYA